jgi:hypothetical protein
VARYALFRFQAPVAAVREGDLVEECRRVIA